jgi:hypothetical protein
MRQMLPIQPKVEPHRRFYLKPKPLWLIQGLLALYEKSWTSPFGRSLSSMWRRDSDLSLDYALFNLSHPRTRICSTVRILENRKRLPESDTGTHGLQPEPNRAVQATVESARRETEVIDESA